MSSGSLTSAAYCKVHSGRLTRHFVPENVVFTTGAIFFIMEENVMSLMSVYNKGRTSIGEGANDKCHGWRENRSVFLKP